MVCRRITQVDACRLYLPDSEKQRVVRPRPVEYVEKRADNGNPPLIMDGSRKTLKNEAYMALILL